MFPTATATLLVPWNFGHIFLFFKVYYNLLSITISVTSRGSDKPVCHTEALRFFMVTPDLSRLLARSISARYVLVRSVVY